MFIYYIVIQIRFIAVNLILDCPKKTQPFTEKELELMKYFIMYNTKNEKPSVKQTSLSFITKVCNGYNFKHFVNYLTVKIIYFFILDPHKNERKSFFCFS